MALKEEIKRRRAEIHSDGYPMSIGELINLYRDGELDIHPEFQRFFRWTDEQKTRLVESILLGIPIPSIFVSQREDGVWDVIDGLQRLSTIFQLVGILKDEKEIELPNLVLKKTRYLPSLEGKLWEDRDGSPGIGRDNQLIIRRSKIDVKIILRESTESSKYELFQRLNTGGSQLSDQELRNVILVTVNPDAYRWLVDIARDENFQTCIALSDRLVLEQYDVELLIRFLLFRDLSVESMRGIGDISEFLTDRIVETVESKGFQQFQEREEKAYRATFRVLAESLGGDSFHKYDARKGKHQGGFSISAYEAIAMGLGYRYGRRDDELKAEKIKSVAKNLWNKKEFQNNSGSGVRASSRIPVIIPLGRRLFAS